MIKDDIVLMNHEIAKATKASICNREIEVYFDSMSYALRNKQIACVLNRDINLIDLKNIVYTAISIKCQWRMDFNNNSKYTTSI